MVEEFHLNRYNRSDKPQSSNNLALSGSQGQKSHGQIVAQNFVLRQLGSDQIAQYDKSEHAQSRQFDRHQQAPQPAANINNHNVLAYPVVRQLGNLNRGENIINRGQMS